LPAAEIYDKRKRIGRIHRKQPDAFDSWQYSDRRSFIE
jgi:hypothetical protein